MLYSVQHDYESWDAGTRYGPWMAGDQVEVTEEQAAWLNRTSPGVLKPTKPPRAPRRRRAAGSTDQAGAGEGSAGEEAGEGSAGEPEESEVDDVDVS